MDDEETTARLTAFQDVYETGFLSDVTLSVRCGDRCASFKAHRLVLAMYPSCLATMLHSRMREATDSVVVLQDTDPEHFKLLLDYIYGKTIELDPDRVIAVLGLADRYQMQGLVEKASMTLRRCLTARNACVILTAADALTCTELKAQALKTIHENFAMASASSAFLQLSLTLLRDILRSDSIRDCDEAIVFSAATRWLAVNLPAAGDAAAIASLKRSILELVRFPLMDTSFLSEVVKPMDIMQCDVAREFLCEAFEHQALQAAGKSGLLTARVVKRVHSRQIRGEASTLSGHVDAVSALAVVATGDHAPKLVSGSWDMTIHVWDYETMSTERVLSNHTGPVLALATVARRLVSASSDARIMVWNPETWNLVRTLDGHEDQVNCVLECEGRLVSGSDDGTIKLWNTRSWSCEMTLHHERQASGVLSLAVVGERLVSGTSKDNANACIAIWNTQHWTCDQILEAHSDSVWALRVLTMPNSSDGSLQSMKLVSASVDQTLTVWDAETWTPDQTLCGHSGPVYALACLDGKIVSGSHDETIVLWEHDPTEEKWKRGRELTSRGVWALTVWQDRLVSGLSDNTIQVWR